MESRTRFDLSAAIQGWREQLAEQPELTPGDRREIEAHLHDSIAALRERGLTDEESFWLARRRVGHPQLLAEEFAKEDPAGVWRERLFWLVIGIGVMRLWSGLPAYLLDRIRLAIVTLSANNFHLPDWILFYVPFRTRWVAEYLLGNQLFASLFRSAPLICLLFLFARGRMDRAVSATRFLFESRARFLATAAAYLVVYHSWAIFATVRTLAHVRPAPGIPSSAFAIQMAIGNAVISGLLVCLITWLMPVEKPPLADVARHQER
jgi:hypothetical protein